MARTSSVGCCHRIPTTGHDEKMPTDNDILNDLLERVRADNHAWLNGDSAPYEFGDERSTILSPFGGAGVGATVATPGQRRGVAQFESGSGTVEFLNGGVSGDVAWLVMIERCTVKFADREEPRRWDLRVTEVFERQNGEWVRVHRHADPLVDRRGPAAVLEIMG